LGFSNSAVEFKQRLVVQRILNFMAQNIYPQGCNSGKISAELSPSKSSQTKESTFGNFATPKGIRDALVQGEKLAWKCHKILDPTFQWEICQTLNHLIN
jgi:hypothetical protein